MLAVAVALLGSCSGTSTTPPNDPQWWTTCGDPVCNGYGGPFEDVPLCAEEAEGDGCADEGAQCDLESDCNVFLRCAVDDPKGGYGGCPISLASAKKDIRYLDPGALRSTADEALSLQLATWRYRSEPNDARTHLGFVIDDRPTSPAVAADGGHVDLYGYTSLAIAAIQVQQAEIEALRAEVETLRREIETTRAAASAR
jgi:hypothetical protein